LKRSAKHWFGASEVPFFSIIVATFNAQPMVGRLLDSLCSQDCHDFEVIIQDGLSTDTTGYIVASYGVLPINWKTERDCGIYDAWNKALLRIQGDWILFLGADDALYASDTLTKVKDALTCVAAAKREGDEFLFAAGGVVVVSSAGVPLRYISGKTKGGVESLHKAAIPTPFPGLFMHISLFTVERFDAGLRIAGDYDFLCRAWKDDRKALRLPFLVTAMTDGGVSTQQAHSAQCCKEVLDAAEKYFCNGWTPARRSHYQRTRFLSALYRRFPAQAPAVHSMLRTLLRKPKLAEHNSSLPPFSPTDVPVFIISYNRLPYLRSLMGWLEKNCFTNIIVVDNASSYPPLLAYLDSLPYRIVRLKENLGHLAVWKCGLFADILDTSYFIVADQDDIPCEECPEDAVMQFYNHLLEYPRISKCGFSLRIDDIPPSYPMRSSVLGCESQYWVKPLSDGSGFFAPIETTFALYRPGIGPDFPGWHDGIRLAPPYVARHLPWYEDPKTEDEEGRYSKQSIQAESTF
jgi:glycosyltransferase involved in cell wall biosynthesis